MSSIAVCHATRVSDVFGLKPPSPGPKGGIFFERLFFFFQILERLTLLLLPQDVNFERVELYVKLIYT